MPKIVKPLTATQVETARFKGQVQKLYDGQGLYLHVIKTGRFWRFEYKKPITKKATTLSLGRYPLLSLQDARKIRDQHLADLAKGVDPQVKKKQEEEDARRKEETTLQYVYDLWLPIFKERVLPQSFERKNLIMRKHFINKYGDVPIHLFKLPLVVELLQPMANDRKFASRILVARTLKEIFSFAVIMGLLEYNPLSDISKAFPIHTSKHRLTISPKDLPSFLIKLKSANENPLQKIQLLLLILNMVRNNEMAKIEYQDVDLEKGEWHIPAEKMKGKKGKKRQHIIPLSSQSIRLFQELLLFTPQSSYIFSYKSGKHSSGQILRGIIRRLGYGGVLDVHGFRSTASTYLNDIGADGDVIEACLAHRVGNDVRNAYNRSTFFERRKPVMQQWGDYVEQCAGGDLLKIVYNN